MKHGRPFTDLPTLAEHLRQHLQKKKYVLIYAYNGTGKTRLSTAFKDIGKNASDETRDTLYFNAFTEDLFSWDNDLDGDLDRRLKLNSSSRFFAGLADFEMDNRIRPLLQRYADFDFRIDSDAWVVRFSREADGKRIDNIKISRGEENIFVWCFFLAIVELALDAEEDTYRWVKYIYIDDPISSLDEHNAIAVGNHFAQLLKANNHSIKTVVSSHHALFFNVLCNELGNSSKYFLGKHFSGHGYLLHEEQGDTPFFQHVATLVELYAAMQEDRLYTYHFSVLRAILEKTASFHGFKHFSACIKKGDDDPDEILHARLMNILSHGNYSLFEARPMLEENKGYFRRILIDFLEQYEFNPELFQHEDQKTGAMDDGR